jgi:integrase
MESSRKRASGGGLAFEEAIAKRTDGIDAGNYRRATRTALEGFADWCEQQGIRSVGAVRPADVVRYVADHLGSRVRDDELSARSARSYYRCVRASFTWWQKMGYVAENPAKNARAEAELPETTTQPDRQYWQPADVAAVERDASRRIDEALAGGVTRDAVLAMRDRALLVLLAYSGARGAELCREPGDEKRTGLAWDDLDWDRGLIAVLGKTRKPETALLTDRIRAPLRRYRDALDPASEDWPVVPALDHATLSDRVTAALRDRGRSSVEIETTLAEHDPLDVCRSEGIKPHALSVRSARSALRRLCDRADVAVDGEYLKPHGGRRGLGDRLYNEQAELAQDALRHKSVETTHRAYREERVARTRKRVDEVIDAESDTDGVPDSYK